jgi:hypothetical protein
VELMKIKAKVLKWKVVSKIEMGKRFLENRVFMKNEETG